MGQGEEETYRKHLMKKCMEIPSVLFSFLDAAIKRRPRATKTEIK